MNDKDIQKPINDTIPVAIKNQDEQWSEYELADGNKLRIKPLVMEIRKSNKELNGQPIYQLRSTIIIDVIANPPKK